MKHIPMLDILPCYADGDVDTMLAAYAASAPAQPAQDWRGYALYLEKCKDDPSTQIMGREDFGLSWDCAYTASQDAAIEAEHVAACKEICHLQRDNERLRAENWVVGYFEFSFLKSRA